MAAQSFRLVCVQYLLMERPSTWLGDKNPRVPLASLGELIAFVLSQKTAVQLFK